MRILPVCGLAIGLLICFSQVSTARGDLREALDGDQPAKAESSLLRWQTNSPGIDTLSTRPPEFDDGDEPRPDWTVWAGAILLQRPSPKGESFLFLDADANDPNNAVSELLNTRSFRFATKGGVDFNVIRHGDAADVDFRYFAVNSMVSSHAIDPEFNTAVTPIASAFQVTMDGIGTTFVSNILSAESNLRQNVTPHLTLLAGFRYLQLREHVGAAFTLPGDPNGEIALKVSGMNNLYGFQVGADGILWQNDGPFRIESVIKAGIYGNNARNDFTLDIYYLGQRLSDNFGFSRNNVAFVGDLNFTGIYQINDNWAVRIGYQLLWVSGVALAPVQISEIDPIDFSPPTVNTSGSLFLHGALTSVQYSW